MSVIGVCFLLVLEGMTPMIIKNIHVMEGNTIQNTTQSLAFTFKKIYQEKLYCICEHKMNMKKSIISDSLQIGCKIRNERSTLAKSLKKFNG